MQDLHRTLERKSAELTALREISRTISQAHDLDTTLATITRKTAEVMGMDSCSLYLLDPQGEHLVLRATTGLAPEAVGRARLHMGEGLTGWAAENAQPAWSSDAASDPRFVLLPETQEFRFRSLLAVPLTVGGRVLGAMNVQTRAVHEFADDEVELLSMIADMAGGAIEKATLYDHMRRQIHELSTLAELSQTLSAPLYLDQVLQVIVEMAARMLDAKLCSLLLVDEAAGVLRPAAAHPTGQAYTQRPPLALGEGVAGRAAQSGESEVVSDLLSDPKYADPDFARREGLRSMVCVPLRVRDRVIGVLNCYRARPNAFSAADVSLLTTLATQTALAIENANLAMRSAVVREMHHRVKNNLQTIAMLLRLQMSDGDGPRVREVLTETINRVLGIAAVHEILSLEGFRTVNLRDVLERIAHAVVANMTRPDLALEVSVEGDDVYFPSQQATSAALVATELIQNALEHAFVGRERGRLTVRVVDAPACVHLEVADDGAGLPAGFDPSRSADLGLRIASTLVREDLHGELTAHDRGGAAFVVTIPKETLVP
ncbi:MAG: GAF domain-containing protein [Armatimonadota bacterium]|nr:GAF domain-containing protein [Armatimonadota bacterium]MDR5696333.1 GAF domain-containing protein [Armatimonadota bacterium]